MTHVKCIALGAGLIVALAACDPASTGSGASDATPTQPGTSGLKTKSNDG